MEIHRLSARELLARLDAGELTSREIVEALFERARRIDATLNAVVHRFHRQALAHADDADRARRRGEHRGPLHGLPITIKENIDTEGVDSTLGVRRRMGSPAETDAVAVRLARESGALVLGKTNVPQTLMAPMETINPVWGTTSNPWNLDRAPGGSSGGEGAALAAGLSPCGLGTDIGGSIRLPAAFCGVAGLKPTADRWSNRGSNTALPGQEVVRSQIGPIARTTDDLIWLMQALDSRRHTRLDPRVAPVPVGDPDGIALGGLRIGVYDDDGFFTPARSVRRAVREAADRLSAGGAEIVPYEPAHGDTVTYTYLAALGSDGGTTIGRLLGGDPIIQPLKLLRRTQKLPHAARKALAAGLAAAGERRIANVMGAVGRKPVEELWELTARRTSLRFAEMEAWDANRLDAVLCPAHPTPAVPHGTSHDFTISFCYVARYNFLDMPAGVVPVTRVRADETHRERREDRLDRRAAQIEAHSEGLPLGVQVVARPWQEATALAIMRAIERGAREHEGFPHTPVDP